MNKKVYKLVDVSNEIFQDRHPMSSDDIPSTMQWPYKQRGMDFSKDLNLKGKYCWHPFNTITVDGEGDIYMCICQVWLPLSIGKVHEFASLTDMAHSVRAREIQASIIDGSYRYCDHNTCGIIQSGELKDYVDDRVDTVNWINFALDASCNLTCPSCRKEFKFISDGPEYDKRIALVDHLVRLIETHDHYIKFTLSGDGDPFASLIYRDLLTKLNLNDKDNVEIEIVTNGMLAKAHWPRMTGVHKNIVRFKISFDAASESVYNITRRGGDWDKLIENSKYIIDWKRENHSPMATCANFVVQQANYKDMVKFVEICDDMGFDEIMLQKITDWGTYDNFAHQAVWQDSHPEFQEFLTYLRDPGLNNKKVNLTNLSDLRK